MSAGSHNPFAGLPGVEAINNRVFFANAEGNGFCAYADIGTADNETRIYSMTQHLIATLPPATPGNAAYIVWAVRHAVISASMLGHQHGRKSAQQQQV